MSRVVYLLGLCVFLFVLILFLPKVQSAPDAGNASNAALRTFPDGRMKKSTAVSVPMGQDIPALIERFIMTNTTLGAPHPYTWVIEDMKERFAPGELELVLHIFSASLDRTSILDERYHILFGAMPREMNKSDVAQIVMIGYSKLTGSDATCEPEKK